jgi:hypothetical protein
MNEEPQEVIPLMAPDEYVHDFHSGVAHVDVQSFKNQGHALTRQSRWPKGTIFVILTCLVTLLSLFYNTAAFARSWRSSQNQAAAFSKLDVSKLRRPSLYLGLEEVPNILRMLSTDAFGQHTHTPVPSDSAFQNTRPGWPSALARVNSAYPNRDFMQDGWIFLTEQVRLMLSTIFCSVSLTCTGPRYH